MEEVGWQGIYFWRLHSGSLQCMIIIASSCYGFVFIRYASPITTNICIALIVRVLILGKLHSDVRVYIPPKTVFDQAWSRTDTQILFL